MTTPTIVDIVHMIATAERAMADGATTIGYPFVRDALAAIEAHPAHRQIMRSDFDGLDLALRVRCGAELLHRLRSILAQVPYLYGPDAADAIATVQAAR